MPTSTWPIETAERDLRRLLEELDAGDMVSLLGAEGMPQALLVSLRSAPREAALESCWEARWDPLAQRVSEAWQGEESAVELLSEMRR